MSRSYQLAINTHTDQFKDKKNGFQTTLCCWIYLSFTSWVSKKSNFKIFIFENDLPTFKSELIHFLKILWHVSSTFEISFQFQENKICRELGLF